MDRTCGTGVLRHARGEKRGFALSRVFVVAGSHRVSTVPVTVSGLG